MAQAIEDIDKDDIAAELQAYLLARAAYLDQHGSEILKQLLDAMDAVISSFQD